LEDEPTDADPAFSPDGRYVFFDSLREGTFAIWRRSLDGRLMERLTSGAGSERWPSLSRDGRRIAYAGGVEEHSLVLKDAESDERSVLPQMRLIDTPMPAPDGRMVAYVAHVAGEPTCWVGQVAAGRLAGQPHRVIDHPDWCANPEVSPDGRWLAFISLESGQRDLWAAPLAGGIGQRLTDVPGNDVDPAWSPDGTSIAFASERSGRYEVWTGVFAEGQTLGRLRQVTKNAGGAMMPTWVADGSRIAYLTGPLSDAWITQADGDASPSRLTTGARAISLTWDDRRGALMALGLWEGGRPAMRSIDPDTGETQPIADVAPSVPEALIEDARVSRNGRLLAWVEQVTRGEVWLLEPGPPPGH
jgi:Tol biopolymer transport system component